MHGNAIRAIAADGVRAVGEYIGAGCCGASADVAGSWPGLRQGALRVEVKVTGYDVASTFHVLLSHMLSVCPLRKKEAVYVLNLLDFIYC